VTVTIDNGPLWLQYLVGFGTAGAALFAGWAAWSARAATRATRDLVRVEQARDDRAADEARWRQARRVTVDLLGQEVTLPDGRRAHDMHARIMNSSPDPISKVRLKIVVGDATWGPQLFGTVHPYAHVSVTARLVTDLSSDNANAFVRFLDVDARAWVSNARTPVQPDALSAEGWIAEGRKFAELELSAEQRGTVEGAASPPDLDAWRSDLAHRQDADWPS
jgi:hypothetical protein